MIRPPKQLQAYVLTRWVCPRCGNFRLGTRERPRVDPKCPNCRGAVIFDDWCKGYTIDQIPFVTKPRPGEKLPELEFAAFDGSRFREAKRRRTKKAKRAR